MRGVERVSIPLRAFGAVAPVLVTPKPKLGMLVEMRFESIPAGLGDLGRCRRFCNRDLRMKPKMMTSTVSRQDVDRHNGSTCSEREFRRKTGDGCQKFPKTPDNDRAVRGLEVEVDKDSEFAPFLQMPEHPDHDPLTRENRMTHGGTP